MSAEKEVRKWAESLTQRMQEYVNETIAYVIEDEVERMIDKLYEEDDSFFETGEIEDGCTDD